MKQSTIAAISTPIGVGGIGVIRISGPDAFTLLSNLFVPKNVTIASDALKKYVDTSLVISHKLYYGHIYHPTKEEIIDEVLVTFMKAPKTYTTENIVEIQAHSGFATLNRLLSVILKNGASIAEQGEFTKRAFLNGRIDLTQAKGIIDLINAKTNKAALLAAHRVKGSTKTALENLRLAMRKIQVNYEGIIEFDEQLDTKIIENNDYKEIQEKIIPKIDLMLKEEKDRVLYQEGVSFAILGAPNVGKSSLMNRLLDDDRSIVTNLPGTTRDIIKDHITIKGLPITLYDTAGLHNTNNMIEKIGINKSLDLAKKANFILLVIDPTSRQENDEKKMVENWIAKKLIVVINKIDICSDEILTKTLKQFTNYKTIEISAKNNLFIKELKMMLFSIATECEEKNTIIDTTSLNLHYQLTLSKTKASLNELLDLMINKNPIDILSQQMDKCISILDEVSGVKGNNDLYEHIFSNFCVGK